MNESLHLVCPHCGRINRIPVARTAEAPRCGACQRELLGGPPLTLDDAGFNRYLTRNDLPVLVDFWAEWCGPCKMMAPAFASVSEEFRGRVLFAKLETDAAPQTAGRYNIRSIPTLIMFRGGEECGRVSGALDAAALRQFVERHRSPATQA